jgi:V8-like Glu-specific endopeptidase
MPKSLLLVLLLAGCQGIVDKGSAAADSQAIVGGTLDVDAQGRVLDPAVGMLSVFQSGAGVGWACTTTLIAPSVLLTAGHCVRDEQSGAIISSGSYQMRVGFGLHPDQENAWHDLVGADTNYRGSDQDIAVLYLATPITNVTPIPLPSATQALPPVGGSVHIVGYGVTLGDRNDAGTKRQVTTTFNGTEGDAISVGQFGGTEQTTHATCFGDSGGPTFYNGRVIGVTSYGLDQQCLQGSFMTNVGLYADWVNQRIAAHGGNPTPSNPPACLGDESEPNDDEASANPICPGGEIVGICDSASDVDVFTFTAAPGQTYDVTLAAPGGYRLQLVKVLSGSRSLIDSADTDGTTPAEIARSTQTGGTYFVHVDAPANSEPGVYYTLYLDVR